MAAPSFGGHEPVKSYVVGLPRIVAKICQIICDVSFFDAICISRAHDCIPVYDFSRP